MEQELNLYISQNIPLWFKKHLQRWFPEVRVVDFLNLEPTSEYLFLNIEDVLENPPEKNEYPNIFLFTEESIDGHLPFLSESSFPHIFSLQNREALDVLKIRLEQLSQSQIPSVQHFCPNCEIQEKNLSSPMEIEEISHEIVNQLNGFEKRSKIRMVLVETITNAFFYGARDEDPSAKFNWDVNFELEDQDRIQVSWGVNEERLVVSVKDFGGKLNSSTLLHWLNRQTTPGETGLPLGIYDTHGRGLFISRKLMDFFFVNVNPGNYSECLMIAQRKPFHNSQCKDISFYTAQ